MEKAAFEAPEYQPDGSFAVRRFEFSGDEQGGWRIQREGKQWLKLPAGYRLLETRACGICATDLARRFLPFPLPQITGHEVLAQDQHGRRCCVEINASHATRMRGIEGCPFCSRGLGNHCPERLVLGIHDLPGGFGPYILAPVGALKRLPDEIPDSTAVLVEPLAAALHAVDTVSLQPDDRIAVLGPRRLGML
ncbi:MAG TPA: alcohol dehydrogenase catalytic domain-containing protein, partial [Acidobacteriota bacterium]|nr:alcohol dehydrogenase catalytic domain-containing protein [Acidobacteriota bacterium]